MAEINKGNKVELFVNGKKIGETTEDALSLDRVNIIQSLGAPDIQKLDRPQPLHKQLDMDLYK